MIVEPGGNTTVISRNPYPQVIPIEDIVNMPLDTFAIANLEFKVASKVLGENILFVSNDEIAKKLKDEGFIVYTAQELKTIVRLNPDPEALKRIHEVKQVFSGSKIVQ